MKLLSEAEYDQAVLELDDLLDADPEDDSLEGQRIIELTDAIYEYEEEHYPIELNAEHSEDDDIPFITTLREEDKLDDNDKTAYDNDSE